MNSQVMKLPSLSPGLDMESYLRILGQFPILSAGEERELAIKFTEEGDLDAARKLVLSHLRFVAYLARSYKGYGLPYEDLVQEGNVGLMKAVKRFDPSFGVEALRYAMLAVLPTACVWSSIHFYLASRSLKADLERAPD